MNDNSQYNLDDQADKLTQYQKILQQLQLGGSPEPLPPIPYAIDSQQSTPQQAVTPPARHSAPPAEPTPVQEPQAEAQQAPMASTMPQQTRSSSGSNNIDFTYDKLQQLLANRQDQGLSNTLLRAGMMANQGIARMSGADVKPDEGALKALDQQANMPLENFSTKLKNYGEIESQDPNSDISKFARERAKAMMLKMNPKFDVTQFDRMSASQLEKLGFKFGNQNNRPQVRFERVQDEDGNVKLKAFDVNTGEEVKDLGTAGFANQFRIDPNSGNIAQLNPALAGAGLKTLGGVSKPETSKNNPETPYEINQRLNPNTKKLIESSKDDFNKETKDARAIVAGLNGVKDMVKLAENNPAGKPIAAAAITRLFEKGVLTDQDVVRYIERQGIFNSAEDYLSRIATGTFNSTQVKQLGQALDAYRQQQESMISNIANQKAKNMAGYVPPESGVNEKNLGNMIYTPLDQSSKAPSSGKFPMKLHKEGHEATVSNDKELQEANQEGWK